MKKLLTDFRTYVTLSISSFFIAVIDVFMNGANSFSEMTWWGKTSLLIILFILLAAAIINIIYPIIYYIYKLIKK